VKSALVNLHLERRDYYPTLQLLGELRDEYPDDDSYGWITCRVHLTFGGIKAAQDVASEVRNHSHAAFLLSCMLPGRLVVATQVSPLHFTHRTIPFNHYTPLNPKP